MDYEKLGAFYLGKEYDLEQDELTNELVLYDSKDLTTHAVIIGMTGSGKTGLGIGILEEALVDNIPLIAIDPKGDLANLLLSFPDLAESDFRPWINAQEASNQGMSADAFAKAQAKLWKKGLADWGQGPERIAKLRQSVDMAVYTPGSSAGLPVSVLRSFNAPSEAVKTDGDLYRERIATTATSILALLGIEADPVTSREHILISNILEQVWGAGQDLDLPGLIRQIQSPSFERIGVMELDMFYPAKDRFTLAMTLNNLLAAPGFETWLEGEPLDIQRFLYTDDGKARASIFSIAHLSDSERMFFVTMLLNELLAWMRSQSGTSSLRALLYMDEIFGYLPPTANPPSKTPMLTLLKQARAFGVGLVLSTQNPVDLDYKALSNAGTWFIGRLQTERDKERVLEGLEGAAQTDFSKNDMEKLLSGLGKRVFLLHNVHESAPITFHTRWVMSYLSGPMTRDQIKKLMAEKKAGLPEPKQVASTESQLSVSPPPASAEATPFKQDIPLMPDGVKVYYAPASGSGAGLIYYPSVAGFLEAHYSSVTHKVNETIHLALAAELGDGPVALDWDDALELKLNASALAKDPLIGADFGTLPKAATSSKNFSKWQKDLIKHVRQDRPLRLLKSSSPKLTSEVGESESSFRARLAQLAREERDTEIAKLRKKYASKIGSQEERLLKAEETISREQAQAKRRQMETMIDVGTTVLGALLGGRSRRMTAYRAGTVLKGGGRMQSEQMDIERAKVAYAEAQQKLIDLKAEVDAEVAKLDAGIDPSQIDLEEVFVKTTSTNITVDVFALLWLPYRKDTQGRISPDWV